MIRMLEVDARSCPVLLCDECGKRITDLALGAAVYERASSNGKAADVLHVHKAACHDAAERRLSESTGSRAPWQELQDHFIYLLSNAGKPPVELADRAASAGTLGLI